VHEEIRAYLLGDLPEVLGVEVSTDHDDSTPLGDGGLNLESLSILELTVHLEQRFAVSFSDDELDGLAESTIGELLDLVAAKAKTRAEGVPG